MAAPTWEEQQAKAFRLERIRREKARRFYRSYLEYVHPIWKHTRMSDYLADKVQEFVEAKTGNPYDILLITTPPQHGKSITVTESFVSWYLGRNPDKRCVIVAYNDDYAEKFGRRNQEKVERYGANLFGIVKGQKWTKNDFELGGGRIGRVISRGVGGGITGNSADLIIIDDPIKNPDEANSETQRDKVWNAWSYVLKSRLQAGAKIIVIMTPWHEDDLQGRLKLYEKEYVTVIRLPIEAEENDPLGRDVGDALCPELGKDNKWLEGFKKSYLEDPTNGGYRSWTALYQCSPRIEAGDLIKREWWRFYDPTDTEINKFGSSYISVDAAFKDGENNDFTAIQVWGKRGNQYFLRHSVNKHLDFPATVREIVKVRALYPDATRVLIEDKANGSAVIQTLQSQMLGVIGITPSGGKTARVNAVSHAIEGGNVFLPKDTWWVEEFVEQCAAFPNGKHDDMVDSMSQCLNYMIYANGAYLPPDEAEARRIEQENQAREYMTDNDKLYGGVYDGDGFADSGAGNAFDPYGGIYDGDSQFYYGGF